MIHRSGRVLALALALSSNACGNEGNRPGRGEGASGDEPVRLRVATAPYLAFAPLYVAQEKGYFTAEGLDVELVQFVSSEIAVPLLVNGSIDVLPSQPLPGLLNAISRGSAIRLVGRVQDPTSAACSPIQIVARPGLLREMSAESRPPVRRVSLNRQAVMLWLAYEAFGSVGLDIDSLEVVDIPNGAEADAIESGAIDAALAGEPWLSRTVGAGQAESWISVTDVLPDVEVTLLFYGPRLVEREREVGVRFLRALHAALRQLGEGPSDENIEILARVTRQDPAVLRQACWAFGPTEGEIRLQSVARFQEWAVRRGLIDRVVSVDELWDGGFIGAVSAPVPESRD